MSGAMLFLLGIAIGAAIGVAVAWERFIRVAPTVELRITPEVAEQIVERTLYEYLGRRGLTVMPKGREFVWPGEVKR